jgi:hypothetical protein
MVFHDSFGSDDSGYGSGVAEVFENPVLPIMGSRDFGKDVARRRQQLLAAELSRLDAQEYQQDILDHMLHMDVSNPPFPRAVDITDTLTGRDRT